MLDRNSHFILRASRSRWPHVVRSLCGAVGLTALAAAEVHAQAAAGSDTAPSRRLAIGGGTFLTRDRGWNYDLGLELGAAVEQDVGSRLSVSAGVAAVTAPLTAAQGEAAIWPPFPDGLEHAVALRVQARTRPRGTGLYALAGLEALAGRAGNQGSGLRGGASLGAGATWHRAARWALEGQYVVFNRPMGTTRGLLSARLVRRR